MFFLYSMATYSFNPDLNGYGNSATVKFPATIDAKGNTIKPPFKMYSKSSEVNIKVNDQIKPVMISDIKEDGMYYYDKGTPVKIDINTIQVGGRKSRRKSRKTRKSRKSRKSRKYRR